MIGFHLKTLALVHWGPMQAKSNRVNSASGSRSKVLSSARRAGKIFVTIPRVLQGVVTILGKVKNRTNQPFTPNVSFSSSDGTENHFLRFRHSETESIVKVTKGERASVPIMLLFPL